MEHNSREEEKIAISQPWILVVGLVLVFWWHQAPYPAQAPGNLSLPVPSGETLVIPKLSVNAPIVNASSHKEDDIQVFLRSGVVRLLGTAGPGKTGNCYIVGHSSDYDRVPGDYKMVFARLPELEAGDEIQISIREETFAYTVKETRVVGPSDLSVLSQNTGGRKLLTLQTSYPVGSAKQRFIVVAEQSEK